MLWTLGAMAAAQGATLPTGGAVSAGSASISVAGSAMTVRQTTDRAALNWDSFSVGQGNSVRFVQPSATSVALNRVVGSDPSVIQGSLSSNGRVFLLNPNGILFTATSQVNVGGLVASTLGLADADFMAGRFEFAGASANAVVNEGNIQALGDGKGGVIAMIAAKVTNTGRLTAEQGSVFLAAGSKVKLDLGGVVGLEVEQGALDALVANGGAIVAPGGDVLLTAQAAAELPSATVNHTGVIEAQTLVTGEKGRIRLLGDMATGSLAVSGKLDVSAPHGGDGGFVETSAANVGIADGTLITALSAHGTTGTWLLDPDVLQIITGGTGAIGSLPATGQSQISPTALNTALTSANVDLQANTYIDFVNAFTYSGARDAVLRLYAPTIKLGADISSTTNKLGLQFGGTFATNSVTYAGNVFLYDSANPTSVTRTLTTKGGAVTFNGNIGANSAAATAYSLTVDATGGAIAHNAVVDGSFTAYNTTTNASVTLSYKPGSVNAQILVDFTTQTVRSNGVSIPYTGIMPIGFIRLPAQTINLNAQNSISGTAVKCVMTLTDGTTVTLTPAANGNVTTTSDLQVTKISYYTGNASAASFAATGVTYDTPIAATKVVNYLAKGSTATLATGATLAFSGDIAFVAGRFVNNAGAYALTPGVANTWRIWSTNADPFNGTTGDVDGGLLYNYKQYNLAYTSAGTGLLGTGNGLIYTYAPNLTVSLINTIRKTYDGLTTATNLTSANYALAGVVGGDAVTFAGTMPTSGTYASKNVGTGISVSVSGITLANFTATNRSGAATVYGYGLPSSTASGAIGTITAASLTVTANAASKSYNGLAYSGGNGVAYSGFVNSETSTVLGGTLAYSGSSQGAVNAGSYAITPGGLTSSNYLINFVAGTLTVSPVALTVTANAASKTYDGLAYSGGNGVSYSGFVNAETASVLGGALTYGGSSQGAVNAGSYAIAPSGLTSSNYTIGYVNGTLTVSKAALTVTANDAAKTYDGLAFVGGAGVTFTGFVNGETSAVLAGSVAYSGNSQNAINAGTYAITPGGLSSGNYSFTYVNGALTVAKAPLIVTANDDAKLIGTSDTTNFAGVHYDGLVNGETAAVLGGTLAVTRTNASMNSVGTYADVLVPSGLTSTNYALTYRTGSFSIVAADQLLVRVNDLTNTYGTTSTYTVASAAYYSSVTHQQVVLTPNVTANGNDIVITDGVGGSAAFTLSALSPVLSGAGKLSVGVYDIGTTNAVVTSLNFSNNLVFTGRHTVTPRALTVSGLTGVTKTYDGTVTAPIAGLASLTGKLTGDAVSFTSTSALYASKDVGTGKTIAVAGAALTGADAGNYYLNTISASGDITKANLTVTANADAKTYNGLAYAGGNGVTYAGLVNGETSAVLGGSLAYGGTAQGAINVGTYAIAPSGLTSSNYAISYANGALTVGKAALTITATDVVKTYGQAVTLSAYGVAGLQNGETLGSITLASSGAAATAGVAGSPYAIVPSAATGGTFSAANYQIGYVNGTLTVNKAALTVTATAASKNYNGLAYSGGNGVTYSGFVNSETSAALGGSLTYGGTAQGAVNAGAYAITPAGLTSANYAITFAAGTLTVNPVALTVTATNDTKVYDGLAYAGGNGVTYSGFVNSETSAVLTGTVSYGGTSQGAVNAGSYVLTPSGLSSGNYTISYVNGALSVTKAALTVKANDDAKLTGNLDNSPNYAGVSYSGLVNGETGSALGGTLAITRSNAGTETVGTYAGVLVPSGLTSSNYSITYQNGSYSIIGVSQLLVQLDNLTTTYGTAPTYSVAAISYYKSASGGTQVYLNGSFSASGNNITVTDGSYVSTFTLAAVSPLYSTSGNLRVGVYSVDATNKSIATGEPNFNSIFVTGAHTVIQKPLTLTGLTGINKTYDGTKAANISGVGLSGVLSTDAVALGYSSAVYDSKDVGKTRTILVADAALTGTDAANYTFGTFTASGDINQAPLTVTATGKTRTYDATAFTGGNGVTYSGLVNGETSAVLAGTVTYGGVSQGAVDAGTYAITPSGLTSANYAITFADGTLTVNKAALTVTAAAAAKTYDGLAYAGGNGVTYAGFIAGQGEAYLGGSLSYGGTSQGAIGAGTYAITPSGLTATNYDLSFVSGTLTVNKAALVATATAAAKTYDGQAYAGGNGVTYAGFVNNETASVLGGTLSYGGTSQGAVNVGSYVIAPSGKTSANYDISYLNGTLTVGKAALTVIATDATKTYDGLAYSGGAGVSYAGFVNSETASVLGGSLAYSGTSQGAKNVGSYVLTPEGLTTGNYAITYQSGTLTVSKAALTVTAAADSKFYDGLAHSGGNGVTVTGFVNNETDVVLGGSLTYTGTSQGAVGVGTYGIIPAGLTATNYDLTFASGTLTVSPATLRVVANNASKTYDGQAYGGSHGVTYVGFVNSEGTSALSGSLTYGGIWQGAVNAGSYTIVPSGLSANNYTLSFENGALTIGKAPLTVTASAVSKTYGQLATLTGFTTSGLQNSETIGSVTLASSGAAANAGVGSSPYAISISNATGGTFSAANYDITYTTGSLTVGKATLTVTASDVTKTYGQTPTLTAFTSSGLQNSETIGSVTLTSSGTAATAGVGSGPYTITASNATGGTFSSANYDITYAAGSLVVDKAPLSITATDVTKTYGQTPTLTAFTSTGLQNSETIGGVTLASSGTAATAGVGSSPYAISVSNASGGTFDVANYDITYTAGSLTVGKAVLTVAASDVTKTYGQTPTLSAFSTSGLQNSETIGSVTLTSSGTAATAGVGSSPYAISASSATGGTFSSANYDITYAAGSLVVTKAALSITASDVTKTYGQTVTLSAYTTSGLQNSETIGGVTLASSGTAATAGVGSSPYAISVSNATGGTFDVANYDITYTAGSLTVGKAPLTITATDVSKTYGQAVTLSAYTSSGLQNSETIGGVTLASSGTAATAGVGSSPYAISISNATGGTFSGANYDITYTAGSLTVGKATLTVTPGATKTYDGTAYSGGAVTYSGFVNSENATALSGSLTYGGTAQGAINANTYTLTASGQASANYDIVYASGSLVINKALLTVTATDVTKTYGQTPTLTAFASSGLQNSETIGSVTLTSSGTAATAGVGSSPYTITASNATGGTFSSTNYDITYAAGSLVVTKAALSITATDVTKTYGQTVSLSAYTTSGLQNSETIGSVTLASSGTAATAGVGSSPYTITASNATGGTFSSANYDITYAAGSLTVGKAPLTITATDVSKTYGQAVTLSAYTSSGLQNSETIGGVTLASSGTAATAGVGSSPYAISISSATGGTFSGANYDITYAAGSLVVTKAPLSITATDVSKSYGQSVTLSAYTTSGLQNGETIGGVTLASSGTAATAGVGSSPYAISISSATGGTFDVANYDITYTAGSLTVGKATLTVTPGATKTYDGTAYSGGAVTYSGFVNSENATVLSGSLTYGGTAQGAINANTYTLTASGQASANYDIVYATGSLVINKALLTITASDVTKTYGQTPTLTSFTSSGLQNSETIGSVTLASSGTAATAGVGSSPYSITVSSATGGTFSASNYDITYAAGSLTVGKATLTVTASDATKTYGQTPTLSAFTSSGLQNSETIGSVTLTSSGTSATAGVGSSPYAISVSNATGGTFDVANYDITYTAGSLTVGKATLTVTATDVSKTYGQTPTLSAFTSSGLQNSETIGGVTLTSSGTAATAGVGSSPYAISISNATGGTFSSSNYDITYTAGSLTVGKAPLTITATDVSKTYGQTATLSAYSSSGLQNGETIGSVTLTSSGTAATAGVGSSPYTITASNATGGTFSSANYDITYAAGSLVVAKAALSITATDVSKTYGQSVSLSAYSSSGLQNNETIGGVTLVSSGAAATAGVGSSPYAISISNATGGTFDTANYDVTYAAGSLTVGKATLTVTPGATKTYDGTAYTGGAVTYSGFVNSENATALSGSLTYGGTAQGAINANTYTLTASGQSSANYDIVYAPGSLVISKALLTVTATDVSKTYGQSVTLSAYTTSGLQNSETIGGVTLASSGAAATAGVGSSPYAISVSNATGGTFDVANYDITYAPGVLTVGKATLTVTPGATKTYDGTAYSGGAVTYSGFVNSENATALSGSLTYGGTAQGAINANTYTLTTSGQSSANYDIVYATGSLVINKALLTITAADVTKTYGQTPTLSAFTSLGLQNSETIGSVTLTSAGAAATAGVGSSPYGISATGATGGTFNASNYDISYVDGLLTVNRAALTVTASDVTKTYGQTPTLSAFTSSGLQNSETIGSVTLTSSGVAATAGVGASPYAIVASNATGGTFSTANYDITYAAGSLAVGKATLTVAATDVTKTYGQTPTLSAFTSTGLQNGETIGGVTLTSAGTAATAGVGLSPYAISVSNASGGTFDLANYDITYAVGSLTVGKAPLTVTASDSTKTYGQTATLSAYSSSGLQNSETIGSVTLTSSGAAPSAGVGSSPYAIVASNATGGTFDTANYDITYAAGSLTVGKATLTVTPGATKTYDGAAYSGGAVTYSGFVNAENATVLFGSLTYGGTAQGAIDASTYSLTVSGQSSANYDIVYAPGSLVISKALLTITATDAAKTYGQTPTLTAFTSAGLQNSETIGSVTLTSSGATATAVVGASPYAIVASNATGGTFSSANYDITYVDGLLTVGRAGLTVTATDVAKTYGQTPTLSAFASSGLQNGETIGSVTLTSAGTSATAGVGSSPYAISVSNATGGTFDLANYDITYAAGSLTVGKASLTVTPAGVTKTYGQIVTLTAFTAAGLQNGETIGNVTLASAGTAATAGVGSSPYAITASNATGGTFDISNYDITYAAGSLTVGKATLTATPGATKTYDGTAYSGGAVTYSGFVNGETPSVLTGSLIYGGTAQGATGANTYTLTASGQNSANYDLIYAPGSLVINKALLSLAATDVTKTYGQALTLSAYTASGLQNGETIGSVMLASAGTAAPAGVGSSPYAISIASATGGTFSSANYDITYVPGVLTVGRATLTVTPGAIKTYDGNPFTGGSVTYAGFVNGETPSVLTGSLTYGGTAQGATGANIYTLTASGQNAANYSLVYAPGSLVVNKAGLTVAALPASKVQDGSPFAGGAGVTYAGFVAGQGASQLGGLLSYGGTSQGAVTAGTYSLMPMGLTSANYDITFLGALLTISPGGDTVDPIPYLLPPVKPKPFVVLTQPIAPTQPVTLGVGGLNYIHVDGPKGAPAAQPAAAQPAASAAATSSDSQSADSGGPIDASALPRSIKGPTDVFIIMGGLNVGEGVLISE